MKALTDARNHRFAGIPDLLEAALLPLTRGQQPGRFTFQIDAGFFAQTELRQIIVHAVDPHVHRQPVIVDIARLPIERFRSTVPWPPFFQSRY